MAQQGELPPIAERDKAIDDVLEQFYKSTDKKHPWLDKAAAPGAGALSMIGAGVGLIPGLGDAGKALKEMPMELSPRTRDSMVGRVGMGVGGILPAILGGEVAGLGAAAAGASDAVAGAVGVGAPAAVIGADAGKDAYARAIANGADENHALAAGVLTGIGTGVGMAVPLHRFMGQFLGKVNASGGGFLKEAVLGAGTNVAATVGTKYFADQVAHNIGNDKEAADLMETLRELGPESALVGGIVSGLAIYAGKRGAPEKAAEKPAEVPSPEMVAKDAAESFKAPETEQAQGQAPDPMRTENPEVLPQPEQKSVVPIPEPTGAAPEPMTPDTSRAQELLAKPVAELKTELSSRLQAEQAELRTAFPDKPESWYQKIEELRRNARDPQNLEGDKSALELKRLGIKTGDFKVEEIADALREKVRAAEAGSEAGKRAYAEKGRGAATAARAEAEQAALDGAVERVGQGPSYHPEVQSQAPTSPRVSIGGGLEGSLTNTLPEGVPPTRKQNVINSFVDILRAAGSNSPLLQGRMPAGARGLFDVLPNVVKIQKWGDLYVASHEVGHALERAVFGYDPAKSPWKGEQNQAAINGAAQKELSKLGKDLYGPTVPNGGYLREGFAEYMRKWLTDPNSLMKDAPAFTQWFERQFLPSLDPSVMKAMEAARTQADAWRMQGAYERAQGNYQWAGTLNEKLDRAMQWARHMTSLHNWVDGSLYAPKFDREMERMLGRKLKPNESLTQAIRGNRSRAGGVIEQFTRNAVTALDGTYLGPSLDQVFAPMKNRYREMMIYLWAKRTLALADMVVQHPDDPNQTMPAPKDSGMSVEDANQLISELEAKHPMIAKVAADFYDWNTNVNKYIASVDPEMGRKLLSMDAMQAGLHPGGWESSYVVLHRAMDGMDQWARTRRGPNNAGRVMKLTDALEGSGRMVKDILPEMLKQVQHRIEAAHQRVPHNVMANMADYYPEASSHLIHLASAEDQLRLQAAFEAAKKPLVGRGEATGDGLDVFGSALSYFAEPHMDAGGKEIVYPIWRPEVLNEAGEVVRPAGLVAYSMNADLYSAVMHMRAEQLTGTMANIGRWGRNMVVLGATGLSMPFGLVKNPMRDVNMFVLNTKHYGNPIAALSVWSKYSMYSFLDALSNGWFHSVMKDPGYEQYSRWGLEMNQSYQMNAGRGENAVKHSRELFQTTGRRAINPTSILDYFSKIVSATEKAGRIAEMKGALKEIGWDGKRSLTPEEIQQAVIAARQVTIDYTQAGELAQKINQVIPFFNSSIQGPVAILRGAKHHPWRFAAIMSAQVAAGYALWNAHKDEKWYQELPLEERARAWHTMVKIDGQDTIVRWYKPQEVGMLTSVVEELTDAIYHKRPVRTGDLMRSAADQALPSLAPPMLTEIGAQAANYDFRTGRQIIPDSQVNLAAAGYAYEQHNEYTTPAADMIGHWTGQSPLRIDHFMRTFFGGSGQDIMNGIFGANTHGREWEPADAPVLGTIARRGGPMNAASQSLIDFYRLLDISDGITKSEEHPATPEQERLHKMLVDYGAGIAAMSYVRSTYLKTNAERSKAMEEIVDYAREAVQAANSNTWNPAGGAIARQVGTTRRTIADLNNGKLPRNMR